MLNPIILSAIFPILTWCLMGETMFTIKRMLSIALAMSILAVQYYL